MLDFLTLTHQPANSVLTARWLRKATSQELRQGYEQLLEAALAHNSRFWLVDLRRRGAISADLLQWVMDHFYPNVSQRIQGCVYLAYFILPDHFNQVEHLRTSTFTTDTFKARVFTSEDQATTWLKAAVQQNLVS